MCMRAHVPADTYTHTHTHTHRGMRLNHQKGMKSHSLQELGENFRGYYAKWNTADQLFSCRTYQTIHGEQNRTKQKQGHRYNKGTHRWWPEEGGEELVVGVELGREWVSATGEGDRQSGATFHLWNNWVTGKSWHKISFAMTPSGDGQSLTRCILVINVSCTTLKSLIHTAEN